MPQLPQRLGLNLPDALTSDGKRLAHFLECMLAAVVQPKAHLDNLFFARREGLEHRRRLFLKVDRKSTRLNSSHLVISYAVFCLKKKKKNIPTSCFSCITHNTTHSAHCAAAT